MQRASKVPYVITADKSACEPIRKHSSILEGAAYSRPAHRRCHREPLSFPRNSRKAFCDMLGRGERRMVCTKALKFNRRVEIRGAARERIDGDMGIGNDTVGEEGRQNLLSRQLEIDGTLDDNRFRIESVHLEWPVLPASGIVIVPLFKCSPKIWKPRKTFFSSLFPRVKVQFGGNNIPNVFSNGPP